MAANSLDLLSLPDLVIYKILTRLSAKSVLRCRCACRSLRDFTNTQYFRDEHLKRRPNSTFLFQDPTGIYGLDDIDEPDRNSCSSVPLVPATPSGEDVVSIWKSPKVITFRQHGYRHYERPVNSVNGLVCYYTTVEYVEPCYVVWNPILNLSIRIPSSNRVEGTATYIGFSAFGFNAKSDEYKIVRFVKNSADDRTKILVHTVGTGSWRIVHEGLLEPAFDCTFDPFLDGSSNKKGNNFFTNSIIMHDLVIYICSLIFKIYCLSIRVSLFCR